MLEKIVTAFNDPLANFAKVIIILAALILAAIYMSSATNARDWAWFQSGFEDKPYRIVIYKEGMAIDLYAGEAEFEPLAEAVRASVASGVEANSHTGLSVTSLDEAYTRYVTVEAYFSQPVKVHAWFFTGHPTRMLFPITGRHSDRAIVFLGTASNYMSDAPILKTKQPLLDALASLGYGP